MDPVQYAQAPSEPVAAPKKKIYVRRKKVVEEVPSKNNKQKLIVARKIQAGQTIELSDKKISMPRANSLNLGRIEMLPQSLAVVQDEFGGPPVDKLGNIIEWGILGEPEDFMAHELKKTGQNFKVVKQATTNLADTEEDVLTARSSARQEESRREREKLAKMLPEDRIIATKNVRALQRWDTANEEWDKFKKLMMNKLNTNNEGSLLISKTDDFRNKAETYELVEKATPIWNKYGAIHWQMTLRGETSHFVPLGNHFSGLYCKIGEDPNPVAESIRRSSRYTSMDQAPKNGWRESEFLGARIKQLAHRMNNLQPNFTGQLAALEHPVKETNPLGDLKIVGTDLFAPDPEPEKEHEMEATMEMTQEMPLTPDLHHIETDESPHVDYPEGVLVMGPSAEVITQRIVLTCRLGDMSTVEAEFVNMGSTSLNFEWKVRQKQSDEPSSEDTESCIWGLGKGSLLPGEKTSIPFLFIPTKPGIFLETLELHTIPALPDDNLPLLMIKGVCELPDDNGVVRTDLANSLAASQKSDIANDIVEDVVDSIQPPMPDEHFHRFLFYTKNSSRHLYYYKENCRAFCKLAQEAFDCHKRAVRNKARWDFSTDSLLEWIETVPFRNSHKIPDLKAKWEALVTEASVRPDPDPTRYKIVSELLTNLIAQIPRISEGHRAELVITDPLPHIAVQQAALQRLREEEERLKNDPKAKRAAAKKAKTAPPKLSPEEQETKAAEETELATSRAEERKEEIKQEQERAVLEEQYQGLLQADVTKLFMAAMKDFDNLTIPVDTLPTDKSPENEEKLVNQAAFVARVEELQARPVFNVTSWGNGVPFPDLGEKKEDPNAKKQKKKKLKKGEEEPVLPVSPMNKKNVVLVSCGATHAMAYTTEKFFYYISNPDPNAQAAAGGGKGKKTGKTSSRGGKRTGTGGGDEKDEGESLPRSIPQLQGYNAISLACGVGTTLFSTEDGFLFLFDHENKELKTLMEGNKVISCSVSPDGQNFFAVTESGELWSMGENTKIGFLGHNDKNKRETMEMVKALKDVKVVSVACGSQHAACLDSDGNVYGWGEAYGCGVGDKKPKAVPEVVPLLTAQALGESDRVVQVVAGANITMARTSLGKVYTWGKGSEGNLGHGDNKDKETPEVVQDLQGKVVTNIAAGDCHSMAFCEVGMFTWGKGANGALGHNNLDNKFVPTLMDQVQDYAAVPVGIAAGGNFSIGLLQKPLPPE